MSLQELYRWCSIPVDQLEGHPDLKTRFRLVKDSAAMGTMMARELVDEIKLAATEERAFRAIIPCGPKCWYEPFTRMVNEEKVSLHHCTIFHMDECLNWQGKLLPENDPYNFKTFMNRYFYGGILPELEVPVRQRVFPEPEHITEIKEQINEAPIDYTLGGWGQDGHIAYNQGRRHAYSPVSLEQLKNSELRVQENNEDTIIALAQRALGTAWQFVPPMSITLGVKECLSARKVRVYSDTGAWKQTALRVGLFSGETAAYPITLLQSHPDALITATYETASHPIAENPDWQFEGIHV